MLKKIAFSAVSILLLTTPLVSSALTAADARTQIQTLLAQIATLQAGLQGSTPSSNAQPDDYGTGSPSVGVCPNLSFTMQRGSRDATTGVQVSALQVFLANRFNLNDDDVVTGYFGGNTERYVKQFQTEQGLPALGIVGSLTRATIARICAGSIPAPTTSKTSNSSCAVSTNKTTAVPGEQFTISWATRGMASPVMYQQVKGGGDVAIATSGSMPWTAESAPSGVTQIDKFEIGSGGLGAPYKPVCSVTVTVAAEAVPQTTTDTIQPQISLGTYQGFMDNQLFITTPNISQTDALVQCQFHSNRNPSASLRCVWNGTEIFSRTAPPIVMSPTTASSGEVTISTAIQPSNSLAPQSVINLAFIRFSLTNQGSAPATLNNPAGVVSVELSGPAATAVFKSVVLLDSSGNRVGQERSFLSPTNKQVAVGDTIVLGAGETKTFVIAGNMADSLNLFAGTSARLSVVGINATQGVAGALPIIGASHTINASLAACPDPNHIFGFQCAPSSVSLPPSTPANVPLLATLSVYVGGTLYLQVPNVSETDALTQCKTLAAQYPHISGSCNWGTKQIYVSNPPPTNTASVTPPRDTLSVYVGSPYTPTLYRQVFNVTEADALSVCKTLAAQNPTVQGSCNWGTKQIYVSSSVPPALDILSVYVGTVLYKQVPNVTEADALNTCKTLAAQNPGVSGKCVWGSKEIYNTSKISSANSATKNTQLASAYLALQQALTLLLASLQ